MKRQRAIIQDMSKNIQKDILNSVSQRKGGIDPVDFSQQSNLHVINRNLRRDPLQSHNPSTAEDNEELKRF
jgi:hypothetical protein